MACAIGTSSSELRRSSGARSRVIRKPKPTVTAETPSGSMKTPSRTPVQRPVPRVRTNATIVPSSIAIAAATTANSSELSSPSTAGTSSALRWPVVPSAR